MKILKRNQIIISVLALMLITVGYMSFTSNMSNTLETSALMDSEKTAGIGDAKLVNSGNLVENDIEDNDETAEADQSSSNPSSSISSETIDSTEVAKTTNSTEHDQSTASSQSTESSQSSQSTQSTAASVQTDYFATSKLERDKMYSQMLETYQNLVESNTISAEQKNISTQEITNINNTKNSIMIAENLIKNLGFEDVVIFVNDNSTSVIIKAETLSEADIAKIQNIVCREIGVETEFVHISLK